MNTITRCIVKRFTSFEREVSNIALADFCGNLDRTMSLFDAPVDKKTDNINLFFSFQVRFGGPFFRHQLASTFLFFLAILLLIQSSTETTKRIFSIEGERLLSTLDREMFLVTQQPCSENKSCFPHRYVDNGDM
jgi:hypothetical protein